MNSKMSLLISYYVQLIVQASIYNKLRFGKYPGEELKKNLKISKG